MKLVYSPSQEGGADLMTLLDETEQLRQDVKTKDALLLNNEERLERVNMQRAELEKQYSDILQRLEEEKEQVEAETNMVRKELEEKEEQLRIMIEGETSDKKTIKMLQIEQMYLKKKLETQKIKERELMKKIVELQGQSELDENQLNKLAWIADNLEKEIEGVQPEFERQRSQMMANIYKLLTYVKIPEEALVSQTSVLCHLSPAYFVRTLRREKRRRRGHQTQTLCWMQTWVGRVNWIMQRVWRRKKRLVSVKYILSQHTTLSLLYLKVGGCCDIYSHHKPHGVLKSRLIGFVVCLYT